MAEVEGDWEGVLTDTPDALPGLGDLETITDAALGRLDIDRILGELLLSLREVLNADTAAVLLLDESGRGLVTTAASGLEEDVRRSVRVPLGRGFAGRIAAEMRPLVLDRVDATTVNNPILWERGIRVMLGVPLVSSGRLIGVLYVGRLREDPFLPEDEDTLASAAERVAGATQARRLAVEQAAAAMLERSLLPGKLPACEGLEMAGRYVTPEERTVGGDWYDVFVVPPDTLWVVAGDVAGHGLQAAVVMGRVRSALRAYALVGDSPASVLELTDRKVQHFEVGTMVTAVCAASVPPYAEWRIATAGHPPPAIAPRTGKASLAALPVNPPMGGLPGIKRSEATVALPEGALMLLYTDGLVERRDASLDAGFERLCTVLRASPPAQVCRRLLRDMVGPAGPRDDVALLAIRRTG